MKPNDTPFPPAWWGMGLGDAGLAATRSDVGTYGRYHFDTLPRPPALTGDFAWLASADQRWVHIGQERKAQNASNIVALRRSAVQLRLCLPDEFIRFVETPTLHKYVQSNTDCFLDITAEPVPSPLADGYLVRFLADSQGCVFWSLYLLPDGEDHAVVSSTKYYETEPGHEGWESQPDDIVFCAESFEEFMWRFWIENEIWFANHERRAIPQSGIEYIAGYRGETK